MALLGLEPQPYGHKARLRPRLLVLMRGSQVVLLDARLTKLDQGFSLKHVAEPEPVPTVIKTELKTAKDPLPLSSVEIPQDLSIPLGQKNPQLAFREESRQKTPVERFHGTPIDPLTGQALPTCGLDFQDLTIESRPLFLGRLRKPTKLDSLRLRATGCRTQVPAKRL